jgi:hypothetical protein
MPAPTDPNLKAAIEQAYINSKFSPKELSEKFDGAVSDRTIERWAKDSGWEAKRTAAKVINLDTNRTPRENPRSIRRAYPENTLEILNEAISDLYGDLGHVVGKDKAAIANSLKGLLEYREKLQPPTIEDLAALVIEQLDKWQLSPRDFALHLKQRQEERNRA